MTSTGGHQPSGRPAVSPEHWQRISGLLDDLLERPAGERAAVLDAACGTDEALRGEVEAYLRAGDTAGDFLETPAMERAAGLIRELSAAAEPGPLAGDRIGAWRLERELGRGGMGVVWLAARADGQFQQAAALKLLKRGLDTDEILGRFLRERQILARLQHPGIARLLDGGATTDGRPWFAMEYVEGRPITEACAAAGATGAMPLAERLRLFRAACAAVQYAHANLVVHRDLKPSNIMVTAAGEVKLLDFGIALMLADRDGSGDAAITRAGLRVMTPQYAAPEQVRGEPATTATDVYALGLVLYELVAGRTPYVVPGAAAAEIERAVLDTAPVPPSRAALSGAGAVTGAPRLPRRLRADLDAIVMTALRQEPGLRHPTAEALGEDIDRLLRGLPVRARRDTVGYRVRKFAGRHRAGVAAAAIVAVALLAGLAGILWEARSARLEARRADAVKDFLLDIFAVSDPSQSRGEKVTARELLDSGAGRIDRELRSQPALQADLMGVLADVYQKLGLYDQALPLAEKSLALERATQGPAGEGVAAALRRQGAVLFGQGKYAEAAQAQRQALEMHRRTGGDDGADTVLDMEDLAATLRAAGKLDEAEDLVRKTLDARRRVNGPNSPETATAVNNLGMMLRERGRFDEAETLYREAIDIRRRVLGPDHPDLAGTLGNLAALLRQRGKLTDAERVAREALAIDRKLYGDDNPNTIQALNALGAITQSLGRYDEAETLDRQVVEFWRTHNGADHPNALASLNNLATVLKDKGELTAAEPLFRDLVARFPKVVGEKHPFTAVSLTHLGSILRDREKYDEAEADLRRALDIVRGLRGDAHPDTAGVETQLGVLEQQRGRARDAEDMLRAALAVRDKTLGPDHPTTAAGRLALAGLLRDRGALDEAAGLEETALTALRKAWPAGHPDIALAALELGRTELARAGPAAAGPLLQEAAGIRRQVFGDRGWKTAEVTLEQARCAAAAGRKDEAAVLAQSALDVLGRSPDVPPRLARAAAEERSLVAR